ncbi:MAG TPA: hypothetical protein VLL77_13375 [Anaerolineales bacterium]|nr:hypothetical protein [Anaerolineales bacterium]
MPGGAARRYTCVIQAMPGLLTLIGSGEVSAGMVKVHRALLDALGEPARPAFLDTPAGFELGIDAISRRFVDYFLTSLDLPLGVASYHSREDSPEKQAEALASLSQSNYVIAGPGSPTYAIDHLRGTAILATILNRWEAGGQLVFASAATVSLSRHALPVYEIYKVGQPLQWHDGLDLLGPHGCELAIVPHWDNAEGGSHDTRACFMGMERFDRLREMLPPTAVVLGIDEHTAVTFDLAADRAQVRGKSGVTVLRGMEEQRFLSGQAFPLDVLHTSGAPARPSGPGTAAPADHPSLPDAAVAIGAGDLAGGLRMAASSASDDLQLILLQAASAVDEIPANDEALAPLIEIMIDLRSGLRERNEWALADFLRDRLAALGIELRDAPEGTTWIRR